jgi:hypothetical protein
MADPIRTYRHFREVPASLWRWKNFSPTEIACLLRHRAAEAAPRGAGQAAGAPRPAGQAR